MEEERGRERQRIVGLRRSIGTSRVLISCLRVDFLGMSGSLEEAIVWWESHNRMVLFVVPQPLVI